MSCCRNKQQDVTLDKTWTPEGSLQRGNFDPYADLSRSHPECFKNIGKWPKKEGYNGYYSGYYLPMKDIWGGNRTMTERYMCDRRAAYSLAKDSWSSGPPYTS